MSPVWPTVQLGEILAPVVREHQVDPSHKYPLLGVRLDGHGPFHRETVLGTQTSAARLYEVKTGDFIYSRLFAWRGAFGLIEPEFDGYFVSNEFPTFAARNGRVDPKYLRYWFRLPDVLRRVEGDCEGSTPLTRNRYKEQYFCALQIPLPSLDEQRRIVSRVEELATRVEEARSCRRDVTAKAKRLWQKCASELILAHSKNSPQRTLEQLVQLRGGGTPSKSEPRFWHGRIPWITPKDMKRRELSDSIDHISEEATKESPAKLIEPGAVLVVVRGMILAHTFPVAVLGAPAAINQDMKAFVPGPDVDSEYLCSTLWAFNNDVLELVDRSSHDTRKLRTEKLMAFSIPVPPLEEQRCILAELDAVQAKLNAVKSLQEETTAELDAMLPAILDKAFKGELV